MSKYRRLGKNVLLVFFGNAGSKLINLLLLPFYTSWLSVKDYGITDMLNVYVILLTGLVTASISEAVFVFPKTVAMKEQKSYFSSGLFISLIFLLITALIFLLANKILTRFDYISIFTDYTFEIYALLFVNFLQSYFQQFSLGIDKIKIYSITGIVLTIATAIFSFFFIPIFGVNGFIWAMILASFTAGLYSFLASGSYRYISIKLIFKKHYIEMLKYSIPLVPNALMWWFIGYINRPLIESYSGLEEVGLLAVANKFPSAIIMVFAVFFHSWQISVIEEFGKDDYKEFYNKILHILIFVLCFCCVGLSLLSESLIKLMTTTNFQEAWIYVPILAIAPLFQAISSYSSTNFMAAKKTKFVFYSSIVGAITSILLNFVLIPLMGLWGAVISIVVAHMIMAIARVLFAWRFVSITKISSLILMILYTSLISLSIVFINDNLYKWISVVTFLFALLYAKRSLVFEGVIKGKLAYANYRK